MQTRILVLVTKFMLIGFMFVGIMSLVACQSAVATPPPATPTPSLPQELTFYAWPGYLPDKVMADFKAEYGVGIKYETYGSEDEVVAAVHAGKVVDVMVVDYRYVAQLIAEGALAEIDYRNVPNYKNISANFRNLAHDPENKYTVPYHWGITGLVYRSDLIPEPTSWAILADPKYKGKVGIWDIPASGIGIALKAVGYSINSESLTETQVAGDLLLKIKQNSVIINAAEATSAKQLASGEIVLAVGWSADIIEGRTLSKEIKFVIPQEGTLLWGDNLVIQANSPHQYAAELLLDFLMRPEINAQLVNGNGYATANEAARPFVDPELLNDPVLFPDTQKLYNVELLLLPRNVAVLKLRAEIWQQYLDTPSAAQ